MQAEAILNMRLKSACRKLEEMEIQAEHDKLVEGARELKSLLKSDDAQWERIAEEMKATREALFARRPPLGRRRTTFADAPDVEVALDAGDDRARADHRRPVREGLDPRAQGPPRTTPAKLKFKEGDGSSALVKAQTTDKLLLFATNGQIFTLAGRRCPAAAARRAGAADDRPRGEPDVVERLRARARRASCWSPPRGGYGFIVPEDEVVA